jgi:hypothetical protein
LKRTPQGTSDDSDREIRTDKLVVSGKKKPDSFNRSHRFQHVDFSRKNAMETRAHGLAVSQSLLVYDEQAWKVPWFCLLHMALARIPEDRLVRAGA